MAFPPFCGPAWLGSNNLCEVILGATKQPTQQQFLEAHGSGYMGLEAMSLWVLEYPYCHQMITQTHPRGYRRVAENIEF